MWEKSPDAGGHSLTDHVVGDVDLDLSLILERHLALDTLVRLLLFGKDRRNQASKDRKPGSQRPECLGLSQASQSTLFPPPSDSTSPGHRPPPKGLLPCWNWNNFAVCQGQLSQEPRGVAPLIKANP